ncbi:MAG: hypothetical protein ACI8RD_001913 [Bacillariaceae sp.]|jgi:hypothetical protein
MRIRTANNILFGSIVAIIGILANEFSTTKSSNTNHGVVVGGAGVQIRCCSARITTMAARRIRPAKMKSLTLSMMMNNNPIHDTYTNTHTTTIATIATIHTSMKTPTKENNNVKYSLFWFVMGIVFVLGGKFLVGGGNTSNTSSLSSASASIASSIIDGPTKSCLFQHDEQQKKRYTSFTSLFMSIILLLQQRGRLSSPSRSTTSNRPAEAISTTTRSVSSSNTTMNTLQQASSSSLLLFLSAVGTTHYFSTFRLLFSFYGSSIANWYMNALTSSPLITKTITTSFIGVLGDTLAQYIELRVQRTKKDDISTKSNTRNTTATATATISNNENIPKHRLLSWLQKYDRRRGFSVLGENLLISGPLMHFAYNYMEEMIPIATGVAAVGMSAHIAALTHVLLDNFVLDTFFVFIMFVTTGIAEGYMHQIISQLRKDFIPTVKTAWISGLLMMPLQFLLFRFLPLSLRVLGVNIIDIFWEAYISFMVHRRRTKNKQQQH